MTLVMLIMGLILGFVGCIGIVSAILVWVMIQDREARRDIIGFWDSTDDKYGW